MDNMKNPKNIISPNSFGYANKIRDKGNKTPAIIANNALK